MRDPRTKKYYFLHAENAKSFVNSRQTQVRCVTLKPSKPLTGEYNAGVPRHLTESNRYTVMVEFSRGFLPEPA